MEITTTDVKALREMCGAGIMECRHALVETGGDKQKAAELLKERGCLKAAKKAERVTAQGLVESYIHTGGRIGAMVELNCETDFVARTDEFKSLAHDIAMQITAMNPQYITSEEVPTGIEFEAETACLLSQPFIKDPTRLVKDLIVEVIAKTGENIRVGRFVRFEIGLKAPSQTKRRPGELARPWLGGNVLMTQPKYKRVLLKLSGEAFKGPTAYGIDASTVSFVANRIKQARGLGVEIAIVVGGGNIWRGAQAEKDGFDRVTADYAGMLATAINTLALQDTLEKMNVDTRAQSALTIQQVAEPFIRRRAIRHMEKGRVVILASGTGNPYMTTDTAAALRAIELGCEVLLMTKNYVDGVYNTDPRKDPTARKYEHLTYMQALNLRLSVMDATALSLCLENKLPIIVFNLQAERSIERAICGEPIGTTINGEP